MSQKPSPPPASKKYHWELAKFGQCDSLLYKDMHISETTELYIFKPNLPQIVVKILNPI